jgi:peptidoglycan/LPS O-acetylase OafA/YrhL
MTYLYWLPCRGSRLRGSITDAYADGRTSEACLQQMGEVLDLQQPWMSDLNIAAMVLLGVAWLTLVLGLRWQLNTKAVAALPGLATLAFAAFAGVMAIGNSGNAEDSFPEMLVSIMPELVAVVALVAIAAWQPETRGRHFLRLVVVLWGTTAFGLIHIITDYMIIGRLRGTDTPPSFGYLTVATITISAILTVIMTLRTPERGADEEPQVDPRAGSLTPA